MALSANPCMILMHVSELGCRALIVFAFELISVRRQVGYLTTDCRPIIVSPTVRAAPAFIE